MVEISNQTCPYEILIRFDESGSLTGAHKVDRRRVMLGDAVLNDVVGTAQPITIDDAEDPGGLWGVLGETLTLALAKIAEQEAEISALKQRQTEVPQS
jgi:hypothetical protein